MDRYSHLRHPILDSIVKENRQLIKDLSDRLKSNPTNYHTQGQRAIDLFALPLSLEILLTERFVVVPGLVCSNEGLDLHHLIDLQTQTAITCFINVTDYNHSDPA